MSDSAEAGLHVAGQAPPVSEVLVVALYERDSGRIVHLHTTFRHEGSDALDEQAVTAAARNHAARLGHDVEALGSLTSRSLEHARRPHRIDVATGTFEPVAVTR